tara:strand:- start:231 stop:428 length:198 start_codon:yes stop_codon:yes gene_type:complete
MRDQLCKKESNWQEAFAARDWLLEQLKQLQIMLNDDLITRDQLKDRVADLLCVLEPADREENDDK